MRTAITAGQIRAKLKHPIVDGDGHWVETISVHLDYLREVAGPDMAMKENLDPARIDENKLRRLMEQHGGPRMKARFKAVFSSDIGHRDVHRIGHVLPEVYEALEEAHMTGQDFREFTFSNVIGLHGKQRPDSGNQDNGASAGC